MNLTSLLTSGGIGAVATGCLLAIVEGIFGRNSKRAEAAAKVVQAESEKHERWFKEAAEAYDKVEKACDKCERHLAALSTAFYDLLDDLADADGADVKTLRAQVRSAARRARVAAAWDGGP